MSHAGWALRALEDSGVRNLGTKDPLQVECDLKSQGLEHPAQGQV